MKRYILLCCYLLTGLPFLWGQGDPCVDSVGISTDPRPGKAYNNERGAGFANTFNWMEAVYSPTQFAAGAFQGITYFNSPFYNNNYFLNYLCQTSQYKANQLSRLGQQYLANAQARDSLTRVPRSPAFSLTAHPNPFDETLTLRYELPEAAQVSLVLLDLMGRPVMQVQAAKAMPVGPQEVVVDASGLAAGIYHAVLQAGKRRESVKVVKQ